MRGFKLSNEYAQVLGRSFADTPKAVLGAVLVSYISRVHGTLDATDVQRLMHDEWGVLFENGIVPQRPPKV